MNAIKDLSDPGAISLFTHATITLTHGLVAAERSRFPEIPLIAVN